MVNISAIFYQGENLRDFLFAFLDIKSLLKRSTRKGKTGSKFFTIRVDSFSESFLLPSEGLIVPLGEWVNMTGRVHSRESVCLSFQRETTIEENITSLEFESLINKEHSFLREKPSLRREAT